MFRNGWSYLFCELIIFEGDFYTFVFDFVGRASCAPGVAIKYLSPFFCRIGPCYVESCIFIILIFFSIILVSLKNDLIGNTIEYWKKDNFFLLIGTPGSRVFIGSTMGELVFKLIMMIPRSAIQ